MCLTDLRHAFSRKIKHAVEFFTPEGMSLGCALHIDVTGDNTHHMIEACFKSVGRALRQALQREGTDLPSTKGSL